MFCPLLTRPPLAPVAPTPGFSALVLLALCSAARQAAVDSASRTHTVGTECLVRMPAQAQCPRP
jgi:hypothetical protein